MSVDASTIRRFNLVRHEDASGVSGTGIVAVGVVFPNGHVKLMWLSAERNNVHTRRNGFTSFPGGVEDLLKVHGHQGRSTIEWVGDD